MKYHSTSARLEIGKFSLYYERTSPTLEVIDDERLPGVGLPLLFLHGMRGNHLSWWQQVPYFAALGYECVTLDQRGFGFSSDPDNLFCEAHPSDLERLLDHLKIERAVLIGQSMGGWTIVGCALKRPDIISGLVLASSPGGIVTAAMDERIRSAKSTSTAPSLSLPPHPETSLFPGTEMTFLYERIAALNPQPPDDAGRRLRAMNYDHNLAISRLAMPVMCIAGEKDDTFPPQILRDLTTILPGVRFFTVAGAGHSVYFETASVFNQLVKNFLIDIGYKG